MDRMRINRKALDWLDRNTVHRGQYCGSNGLRYDLPTISFGTRRAAEFYAEHPNDSSLALEQKVVPRLFQARLDVSRIYCLTEFEKPDPFFDLDIIAEEFGRHVVIAIIRDYEDAIRNTQAFETLYHQTGFDLLEMVNAWPFANEYLPPVVGHLALRVPEFIDALKTGGYQAVALGGTGETRQEMEWHIFDPDRALDPISGKPLPCHEIPEQKMESCPDEEMSL